MLPGIAGIAGMQTKSGSLSVSYTGRAENSTDAASYTFSSADIGTAADDRYIVIAFSCRSVFVAAPTVNSVTVAGQSCTKIADSFSGQGGKARVTLWITNSAVAIGTTASIVVSLGSTSTFGSVAAWAVYGLSSPSAYDTAATTGSAPLSATIDFPASGILIAAANMDVGAIQTITWTGATEDFESVSGDDTELTGASKAELLAGLNQTISVTSSSPGASTALVLVAATLAP